MNLAAISVPEMPWIGFVPIVLLVVVGLLLWVAGRKVIRLGLASTGLVLGAMGGWIVGDALNLGIPAWMVATIAGLSLACIGALAYRLAVAGALALVLAAAAPMATLTVYDLLGLGPEDASAEAPAEPPPSDAVTQGDVTDTRSTSERLEDELTQWVRQKYQELLLGPQDEQAPPAEGADDQTTEAPPPGLAEDQTPPTDLEQAAQRLDQLRQFTARILGTALAWWDQTPKGLRMQLVLTAVIAALIGLLLGGLFPKSCAAVVTAFGGAMLWLSGLRVLIESADVAPAGWFPASDAGWLLLWLVTSAIGLGIQWMFREKPADKPA